MEEEYPNKTIVETFLENAKMYSDKVAILWEQQKITYSVFINMVMNIVSMLQENDVRQGDVVAVKLTRSAEMVASLYAILFKGAIYLPVDPRLPSNRVKFMLTDCDAKLLLTHSAEKGISIKQLTLQDISRDALCGQQTVYSPLPMDAPVYVMYTSGSTGKPKGAIISHVSLHNRLWWMIREYGFSEADVFIQKTSCGFDVSMWELLIWGLVGGTLVLHTPGYDGNVARIAKCIMENKVTVCHFVPSVLNLFLNYLGEKRNIIMVGSLKHIFSSGEALKHAVVSRFFDLFEPEDHNIHLHNLYGPTEAAIDVTFHECKKEDLENDTIPIGRPIANTQIYIVDLDGSLCEVGKEGELCIAGLNVGIGYVGHGQESEKVFVQDLIDPQKRMYRTGDIARQKNGMIEYIGRKDNQVKINGQRVELGEIENEMLKIDGIQEAVVVVSDAPMHRLEAYYIARKPFSSARIIEALKDNLPNYMIPKEFYKRTDFPRLPSGKIDRKLLVENTFKPTQDDILSLINDSLGTGEFVTDNTKVADLDSLQFMELVVLLEDHFQVEFDDSALSQSYFKTINDIIMYVWDKRMQSKGGAL
jgi:amino acid adenylation domain-containing protein